MKKRISSLISCILLICIVAIGITSCSDSNYEELLPSSNPVSSSESKPKDTQKPVSSDSSAHSDTAFQTDSDTVFEPSDSESQETQPCSHSVENWETTNEPQCQDYGQQSGICSLCGETVSQSIDPLGHDDSAALCSRCGYKNWSVGLRFTLNDDKQSYCVTGYKNYEDTEVSVPAYYKGLPVTAIGEEAFSGCNDITGIAFPNSICYIGKDALDCPNLKWRKYNGASYLSLGGSSLGILMQLEDTSSKSFTIPSNTIIIYENAFSRSNKLESITVESRSKLTQIGDSAFANCMNLKTLSLPSTVKFIGHQAFYRTIYLNSFTIPSGIEKVETDSFENMSSSVYRIHNGLRYVGTSSNPYYYLDGVSKNGEPLSSYTVHSDTRIIADCAFYHSESIQSIDLSGATHLQTIGSSAFSSCSELTEITIPASVQVIKGSAFSGCSNLTIYASVPEAPSTWSPSWNSSNCEVHWTSDEE